MISFLLDVSSFVCFFFTLNNILLLYSMPMSPITERRQNVVFCVGFCSPALPPPPHAVDFPYALIPSCRCTQNRARMMETVHIQSHTTSIVNFLFCFVRFLALFLRVFVFAIDLIKHFYALLGFRSKRLRTDLIYLVLS